MSGTGHEAYLKEIQRWMIETYGERAAGLSEEEPLLGDLLDSLGVLSLANHLEDTYGFAIGAHEMEPGNFGSLRSLAAFVARKTATK